MINFEEYRKLNKNQKISFLGTYGAKFGIKSHTGIIDRKKRVVIIKEITNPFTNAPVEAKYFDGTFLDKGFEDGAKVNVTILLNEGIKIPLDEDAILLFTCVEQTLALKKKKEQKARRLANLERIRIEKEQRKLREKEIARVREKREKRIKELQEAAERARIEAEEKARLEELRRIEEEKKRRKRIDEEALQKELSRLKKIEQIKCNLLQDDGTLELLSFFKEEWAERDFEPGFYHYTDFENFEKIMKKGELMSRKMLENKDIHFHDSASREVLGRTEELPFESVRFFYAPKTPFLYVTEGIKRDTEKEHIAIPVLLLFDEKIMYDEGVHYLDMSGGHLSEGVMYRANCTTNPREALKFNWEAIFSRGPIPKYNNPVGPIGGIADGGVIKAHRIAEFLYPERIATRFIKKIFFRSKASMKAAEYIIGKDERFCLDPYWRMFNEDVNARSINYLVDYSVKQAEHSITLIFTYRSNTTDMYTHKLEIIYESKTVWKDISDICCNLDNYKKEIKFEGPNLSKIERINYYMNDHLSAVWIKGKEL